MITLGLVILTIVTLIVIIIIPKLIFKNQVFSDLLNEYRSASMGIAIKHVWDFFRDDCKRKVENVVKEYQRIRLIDDVINTNEEERRNSLHYHRRLVSQYYRHLAMFLFGRFPRIRERKIKSFFVKGDFEILQIIVPIEESFVKNDTPGSLVFLSKLYYKSQRWFDFVICKDQYDKKINRWKKQLVKRIGKPLEEIEKEDSGQ